MRLEELLARFSQSRRSGGQYLVTCPAHDDRKASLTIREGDTGLLVHCHAGCTPHAVMSALGLRESDLFPAKMASSAPPRTLAATYAYRDEHGALLYETLRYSPKDFRQRRPDGHGGWVWNLEGVRRVLYGLPELQQQAKAIIVEGEKDVDAMRAAGFPATCNVGGAGKWRADYVDQLKAAGVQQVRIIPDHDPPGLAHAHAVAQSCLTANIEARLVVLPDVPEKGDVSDFLGRHSITELKGLLRAAPPYVAPASDATPVASLPSSNPLIVFQSLTELLAQPDEPVEWVVHERIPAGALTVLAGKPKAGKSTAVRDLALQVATGGAWLGFPCTRGVVWYLALEDKPAEIRKHFRAMGGVTSTADVRFVYPQPLDDMVAALQRLADVEKPSLIVVDTLQRLIRARDLNDYAVVTEKMTPLLGLCRSTGAAMLLVHHAGKGDRAGIDAVLGSTALTGSVDNVMILSRTEEHRVLTTQQRIGPDLPPSVILFDDVSGRVSMGGTRADAELATIKHSMLAALREGVGPMTEKDLGSQVEGRTPLKRNALRALVAAGAVSRSGGGRRGDPFLYTSAAVVVPANTLAHEHAESGPVVAPQSDLLAGCGRAAVPEADVFRVA